VEKILGEGALVLLHLEVVFVFGKILGHGDEFVPDVVPPVQHLVGSGKCRTRSLILRLALTAKQYHSSQRKTGSNDGEQREPRSFLTTTSASDDGFMVDFSFGLGLAVSGSLATYIIM
jgi:hypothetical protein